MAMTQAVIAMRDRNSNLNHQYRFFSGGKLLLDFSIPKKDRTTFGSFLCCFVDTE